MRKLRLFFSSLRIHSSAAPTLQSAIRQHTLHKPLLTNPLASTAAIYPLCQGRFQFDLAHVDPHKGLNLFRHISRAATLVWLVTAEVQLHPLARSAQLLYARHGLLCTETKKACAVLAAAHSLSVPTLLSSLSLALSPFFHSTMCPSLIHLCE